MKKEEVFDIAWHLYNHVDQAHHDTTIRDVVKTATVDGLKEMIKACLRDEGSAEWNLTSPDEEIVKKAKRLVGQVSE